MHSLIDSKIAWNKELLDVEESIACYLLKHPDEIADLKATLRPQCFKTKDYRAIYLALVEMDGLGLPIDAIQLELYLENSRQLDAVGGVATIARLVKGNQLSRQPSRKSIIRSIQHLVEKSKREQLQKDVAKLHQELADLDIPYEDLAAKAEAFMIDFLSGISKGNDGLIPIAETIRTTADAVIQRTYDKRAGIESIQFPTGWIDVDNHTGGWQGGQLIILAGRTSMGKSAMLGNIVMHIAKSRPVALFSLEMATDQIERRYLSMQSGINGGKMRDGELDDGEIERLVSASSELSTLSYWGEDNFSTSIEFILSESRKLAAKQGQLGAIAIDYLQLLARGAGKDMHHEIGRITAKLKALSIELNCPIFLLWQLNRAVESRNDKRPMLSDLRESGSIEEDADQVVMIYRDDYYNPDSRDKGLVELIWGKHRDGQLGTVKLVFDGATTSFKNLVKF